MKVLIVNQYDAKGGAARAAYRLHKSLLTEGIDSEMLVEFKISSDSTVIDPENYFNNNISRLRKALNNLPFKFKKKSAKSFFTPGWLPFSGFAKKINSLKPDIVHLHWITGSMMSFNELHKINAPIIWSLHDMWPFSSGYHYDSRFDFSDTKMPDEIKMPFEDYFFTRRRNAYLKIKNLTVVGTSNWINNCSKHSALLGPFKHINLPNPIDRKLFKPKNGQELRNLFGLPQDKKIILFGAVAATSDLRKGFKQFSMALDCLPKDYEVAVFGASEPNSSNNLKSSIHYLGNIENDEKLCSLYNAVDVTVVPSLQENFSNTIMESLACGTPVVGFDIGGNSDMIKHKVTGYLAEPFNSQDLANGIIWVLSHSKPEIVRKACSIKVECEFDSSLVAQKYIKLYESTINDQA